MVGCAFEFNRPLTNQYTVLTLQKILTNASLVVALLHNSYKKSFKKRGKQFTIQQFFQEEHHLSLRANNEEGCVLFGRMLIKKVTIIAVFTSKEALKTPGSDINIRIFTNLSFSYLK